MGRIIRNKAPQVHQITQRSLNREMAERLKADVWYTEREALNLIWNGARNVPDDYARATGPLVQLMTYGLIARRGGTGGIADGTDVLRYQSTQEIVDEGKHPVAAVDPSKVQTVWITLIDVNGHTHKLRRYQDRDKIAEITNTKRAVQRAHRELGLTKVAVRVDA